MEYFLVLLIGISLSMDAFSLAILYGTLQNEVRHNLVLSFLVGIFHFFMPLIGIYFGNIITKYINPSYVTSIIFIFIGLSMIVDTFKEEKSIKILKFAEMFVFAFAVSVDSFSLGMGLNIFTKKYFLSSLCFSICSLIFTLLGLSLGNKISNKIGAVSTLIGGIILSSIGLIVLFH